MQSNERNAKTLEKRKEIKEMQNMKDKWKQKHKQVKELQTTKRHATKQTNQINAKKCKQMIEMQTNATKSKDLQQNAATCKEMIEMQRNEKQ